MSSRRGIVYLVGSGPGDPGLITLRGAECLQRAEVILYDYLVNPHILRNASSQAEQICLGQHGRSRIWSQEEINSRLIELARLGKVVVRLKGGDPSVFARAAEEVEALVDAQVPFEVVPGITAGLAASSYAGIPLTHREMASAVALITAHEISARTNSRLDYQSLASFPGTLVFYMGATTAPVWTSQLMEAGKSPETPAAIIRRCSLPDQSRILCRLADVAGHLTPASRLRPPVIVIVGEVTQLADRLSWFEKRPLFGQTILVTRPAEQACELVAPLEEQGATLLVQPAIDIGPPADWGPVDQALQHLQDYDWLIFSSVNGVRFFFDRLRQQGLDARALAQLRLASIGPATSRALEAYYLQVDLQPEQFRAEALAEALRPRMAGRRCLWARASRGREVLVDQLLEAGATVDQVVVYASTDRLAPDPEVLQQLDSGRIDWVTVTSSAIARSLAAMLGPQLRQTRLASISPVTSHTLREFGYDVAAEAKTYTMAGVVDAILAANM